MHFKLVIAIFIVIFVNKVCFTLHGSQLSFPQIVAETILNAISNETASPHRQRRSLRPVGRCSHEEYLRPSSACPYTVFGKYRRRESFSCTVQYVEAYLPCLAQVFRGCLRYTVGDAIMERVISMGIAALNMQVFRVLFCTHGTVALSSPAVHRALCNSQELYRYIECVGPFHRMYDDDRGNPDLCQVYHDGFQCQIDNLRSNCLSSSDIITETINRAYMIQTKDANPFCSFEQGGADVNGILAGTWRPGVYPTIQANTADPVTTASVITHLPTTADPVTTAAVIARPPTTSDPVTIRVSGVKTDSPTTADPATTSTFTTLTPTTDEIPIPTTSGRYSSSSTNSSKKFILIGMLLIASLSIIF